MAVKTSAQECADPQWELAERIHDWRNYVPEEVRNLWSTFTTVQQLALFDWADGQASNEEWD